MNFFSRLNQLLPAALRPVDWATRRYLHESGGVVHSGPFRGLRYIKKAHGSALAPKIAGSYERELHPYLTRIVNLRPDVLIDIGAAEGYYAVGAAFANWCPHIVAFETEAEARLAFAKLMALNKIPQGQITLRGQCTLADFAATLDGAVRPAAIIDVEGYEVFLLDPLRLPLLARCTLLVEHHDFLIAGLRDTLIDRMRPTHEHEIIDQQPRGGHELAGASHLFRALPDALRSRVLREQRPFSRHGWLWFTPRTSNG